MQLVARYPRNLLDPRISETHASQVATSGGSCPLPDPFWVEGRITNSSLPVGSDRDTSMSLDSRKRRWFGFQSRQERLDSLGWAFHHNLYAGVSKISYRSGKVSIMSDSVDERAKADSLDDTANEHTAAFNRHFESVSAGVCTVN